MSQESTNTDFNNIIHKEAKKFCRYSKTSCLALGVALQQQSSFYTCGEMPASQDSIFQIGSLTKVFTALLLQLLHDAPNNDIYLDGSLADYLGGNHILSDAAKKITLRQLATHTSGLPGLPKAFTDLMMQHDGKANIMLNPYRLLEKRLVYEYLKHTENNHKVGKFVYSNYGMGLLAHLLEKITQQDYATLLNENIFQPLGMHDTAIKLNATQEKHLVQGYNANNQQKQPWTFNALQGAGALYSTPKDLLTFLIANLQASPLQQALAAIRQTQCKGRTGLGWMQAGLMNKLFGNKTLVWHNGMVGAYAAYMSLDQNNQFGLFIVSNKSVDTTMLGMQLNRRLKKVL